MELTRTQIDLVEKETSLSAITQNHSAFSKLEDAFGTHTYFLNEEGLFIFRSSKQNKKEAQLFAFAMWAKEDDNKLIALPEPMETGVTLDLEKPELTNPESPPPTRH